MASMTKAEFDAAFDAYTAKHGAAKEFAAQKYAHLMKPDNHKLYARFIETMFSPKVAEYATRAKIEPIVILDTIGIYELERVRRIIQTLVAGVLILENGERDQLRHMLHIITSLAAAHAADVKEPTRNAMLASANKNAATDETPAYVSVSNARIADSTAKRQFDLTAQALQAIGAVKRVKVKDGVTVTANVNSAMFRRLSKICEAYFAQFNTGAAQ